jgi:hypothetical protein
LALALAAWPILAVAVVPATAVAGIGVASGELVPAWEGLRRALLDMALIVVLVELGVVATDRAPWPQVIGLTDTTRLEQFPRGLLARAEPPKGVGGGGIRWAGPGEVAAPHGAGRGAAVTMRRIARPPQWVSVTRCATCRPGPCRSPQTPVAEHPQCR